MRTEFLAFVDADTYYPPHYLATCARLFRAGGERCVGVMAKDLYEPHDTLASIFKRWFFTGLSKVLPWQAFTGCAGQAFRTAAFRAAGGYSIDRWQYVLQDHELINRIHKLGRTVYHPDHWCITSSRRSDRTSVSWTRAEQTLYFLTPSCGPRLAVQSVFRPAIRGAPHGPTQAARTNLGEPPRCRPPSAKRPETALADPRNHFPEPIPW